MRFIALLVSLLLSCPTSVFIPGKVPGTKLELRSIDFFSFKKHPGKRYRKEDCSDSSSTRRATKDKTAVDLLSYPYLEVIDYLVGKGVKTIGLDIELPIHLP